MGTEKNSKRKQVPAANRLSKTVADLTALGQKPHPGHESKKPSKKRSIGEAILSPITSISSQEANQANTLTSRYAIKSEYLAVPVKYIRVSQWADRWEGEQDYTSEMAESFKATGQMQPSIGLVKKDPESGEEYIEIIAGIMRFRTKEKEGQDALLRVFIVDVDDETAVKIIIDENKRRKNPSIYSEALQIRKLLKASFTRETIMDMFNIKKTALSKMEAFSSLPISVTDKLGGNIRKVSLRIGYPLARLAKTNEEKAAEIVPDILTGKITKPEQIEALIETPSNKSGRKPAPEPIKLSYGEGASAVHTVKHKDGKIILTLPSSVEEEKRGEFTRQIEKLFGPPNSDKKQKTKGA